MNPDLDRPRLGLRARHRWLPDALGVGAAVVLCLAVLGPGLLRGRYFGPVDILSSVGLTAERGVTAHNPSLRDLVALFMPFTNQVWLQVHHGQLPLWNPDAALGMPLAFNWESAPLSLPSLLGELAPLGAAYTVGVVVTLVVSSCGGYVFGRALRLGILGSVLVGVGFTLSGPVLSFLGWSSTSVSSWTGWLFAATVWILRGRRRLRSISAFAVVVAFSIFAGHPETSLMVIGGALLFGVATLVLDTRSRWDVRLRGALRPGIDLLLASVAGLALSAPMLLPGLQFAQGSGRAATGNYGSVTIPDRPLLQLLFQSFDGTPLAGGHWFGSVAYQWTANYLGAIAVVLAAVALVARWRDPRVRALVVVVVVTGTVGMAEPVASALDGLPVVGSIILSRALVPFAFGLAALAGVGVDELVRNPGSVRVRRTLAAGVAVGVAVLGVVWLFGRGHLPAAEAQERAASFVWPSLGVAAILVALLVLMVPVRRRGRLAAGFLLVAQSALLVAVGAPQWSWSSSPAPPTNRAAAQLEGQVNRSLVGLGGETCISSTYLGWTELGILPEANALYGVRQFAVYDPLVPTSYFSAWRSVTGTPGGSVALYQFCPAVTTAALARRFGVGYVLEAAGHPGPSGAVYVRTIAGQVLYRIPGASSATLVPERRRGPTPLDAAGTPVTVHQPDPATWRMTTRATVPSVLRLRLTAVPGWHASVDGRPVALHPFDRVMLEVRLPAGPHRVVLTYWPAPLSIGLIVAGTALAALGTAAVVATVRSRRRRAPA